MAERDAERRHIGLHAIVGALLLDEGADLVDERHQRAAAVLAELAADQIERLDAVGAFVDHGDARVAHELLHAVLGDVAVAAEHLLRHHGIGEACVGEHAFDHRREQAHVIVGALALLAVLGAAGDVALEREQRDEGAAFLMDRIMGGAGLHGRAFIPLLSSFACAIPGIMATRVIDNRRDRLTTILVAPLMTCSARIPVYTLIISAFIPDQQIWGWVGLQGLVMFGLYAAGIFSALAVSFVANHFFWRENATQPFMIELPDYKMPRLPNVAMGLYMRAMMFLKRAGTTIFSMMVLIWFLASFPRPPAGAIEPAINFSLAGQWSLATALALLVWYIFAPQCASTLAVIKRETGSWRWMVITFGYMLALAYAASLITYNVAVALGAG